MGDRMMWRCTWQQMNVQELGTHVVHALKQSDHSLLYYGWANALSSSGGAALLALLADHKAQTISGYIGNMDGSEPTLPSLAPDYPLFLWIEREIWEQSGITFSGHPDLRPILRPDQQELQGVAHGSGVFQLPLGPVRADVSESGHFLFDTLGEQIMHMEPQLFWKHRGIEKIVIGRDTAYGRLLAERISGTSTVSHTVAFCRAAEQVLGISPHDHVELERVLLGELERLYNHVHDFAQMAGAAGMTVGQAQLTRVKEELLRLNARLTGSRYLRNAVFIGNYSNVDWQSQGLMIRKEISEMNESVRHFVDLLLRTPTFMDRYQGTGILPLTWAKAYGIVGPSARASGLRTDSRDELLRALYAPLGFQIAQLKHPHGDALSRFQVRDLEWTNSLQLVERSLAILENTLREDHPIRERPKEPIGLGVAESPRGRVIHVLRLDHEAKIAFFGARSASAWIWPVFGLVTANGNIQTDFPIIDASFGLSYAGNDR